MDYKNITLEVEDGVAILSIARPERLNALNLETVEEMLNAVQKVRDDEGLRVLIITGEGRAFCSGADLAGGGTGTGTSGKPDAGKVLETHYNPLLENLMALNAPIITAVKGPAAGAGCSLALYGDFVIAADDSYFLQAFVNIGLVPDVGSTWLLPRLIGRARATEMMMLGEKLPATKAEDWGMIYKTVPVENLMDEAKALARRLASGPTLSYALIRQGIRDSMDKPLSEALRVERVNQMHAGRTKDFTEGVRAFAEKRKASFSGQ